MDYNTFFIKEPSINYVVSKSAIQLRLHIRGFDPIGCEATMAWLPCHPLNESTVRIPIYGIVKSYQLFC